MVIDKTTKKCVYPKQHQWCVNNNKLLIGYIRKQTFGIENLRYTGPSSSFNGFQLSKSSTNNIVISIVDDKTGNQIAIVKGTVDDINKTFVHGFNKSTNIDKQLNQHTYKQLIEYLLTKPTATDNQIIQYLIKNKFKSSLINGISNSEIVQCKQTVNHLYKLLRIQSSNYVIDNTLIDFFKLKDVDCVLVAKSYRSKADQFNYDKKIINDRRYKQSNSSKIINTILYYRLLNKQIIPIKIDQNNSTVCLWDPNSKLKNDKLLQTKNPKFEIQSINWDSTLTTATINFNNKHQIKIDVNGVDVSNDKQTIQYRLEQFKTVLTRDNTTSWPNTFKDDTNQIKTILTAFDTNCQLNGVTKSVSDFETVYQELQPQQQIDAATVLKIIRRILDTIAVDNCTILLYYLLCKQPIGKPCFVMM